MGSKVLSFNEAPAKRGGKCPFPGRASPPAQASMRPPRNAGESGLGAKMPGQPPDASMRPPRNAGESALERRIQAAEWHWLQ